MQEPQYRWKESVNVVVVVMLASSDHTRSPCGSIEFTLWEEAFTVSNWSHHHVHVSFIHSSMYYVRGVGSCWSTFKNLRLEV